MYLIDWSYDKRIPKIFSKKADLAQVLLIIIIEVKEREIIAGGKMKKLFKKFVSALEGIEDLINAYIVIRRFKRSQRRV